MRNHRAKMDARIAPVAQADVDVAALAKELCENDFYREDYELRTKGLISDNIDYGVVINFYRDLIDRFF